jgi:hypothetical protein
VATGVRADRFRAVFGAFATAPWDVTGGTLPEPTVSAGSRLDIGDKTPDWVTGRNKMTRYATGRGKYLDNVTTFLRWHWSRGGVTTWTTLGYPRGWSFGKHQVNGFVENFVITASGGPDDSLAPVSGPAGSSL